jgi:hypothetical protein
MAPQGQAANGLFGSALPDETIISEIRLKATSV